MSATRPTLLVIAPDPLARRNAALATERTARNAAREAAMIETMRANRTRVRRPWWQRLLPSRSTFQRALDIHIDAAADLSVMR